MPKRSRTTLTLKRGDLVGVVATGFAVRGAALEAGLRWLQSRGFEVRLGEGVLERDGYLAGADHVRARDLDVMLRDPEVRAVWFARGGYGTSRILDRVDWPRLRSQPKLLIGYSDLTALFAPALRRSGASCLYGPVVSELGEAGAFDEGSLLRLLAGKPVTLRFPQSDVLVEGRASGPLAGGNLTVLAHLWGTRFAPALRGSLLFLEDVGEEAYRLDRALTQLRLAGAFKGLRGVLLGRFSVPPRRRFPPDRAWIELVRENFVPLGIPIVGGLPAGHGAGKWTLPLGGRAELDTARGRLRLVP